MTLYFIFRLVLYSHEDDSFNTIFQNVFEGIKKFILSMWFMKNRLETLFKGDNVKTLIKNVKNWSFISLRKLEKMQHLLCFFLFSVTKQSLENVFGFPQ